MAEARSMFKTGGHTHGAHVLGDALSLIADEIAALDKEIGGTEP